MRSRPLRELHFTSARSSSARLRLSKRRSQCPQITDGRTCSEQDELDVNVPDGAILMHDR